MADETVNGSNVAQLVDGELEGRLHSVFEGVDFTNTSVKIYDSAKTLVGETTANASGHFAIADLETGYYEFVASGTEGYAAFGFEAVEANEAYTSTAFQVFDATLSSPVDSFSVSDCATCGDVVYGDSVSSSPVEFAAGCTSRSGAFSSCGGGCGAVSSCCGGGGGFGGGRLFGGGLNLRRLALLGAAVAIPIAVSGGSDDADGGGVPPATTSESTVPGSAF